MSKNYLFLNKKLLLSSIGSAVLLIPIFSHIVSAKEQEKQPVKKTINVESKHADIARLAAGIIANHHYKKAQFNDDISKKLFQQYFKKLDPQKYYFTQDDINQFAEYETNLDDDVYAGRVDFAYTLYELLKERANQYEQFAKVQLKKGFDFNKKDDFFNNRAKAAWCKDMSELQRLWYKRLKSDVLYWRLVDRARKEELTKEDKKKAQQDEKVFFAKTPEERVLKRISMSRHYLTDKDAFDVLQLFLSSLTNIYDPHSDYMSPATQNDFQVAMSLSLVGIGAVLQQDLNGYTKIRELIKGGPAEKSKLIGVGDRIIAVSQAKEEQPVDIIDMPLNNVVKLIRGKKNTDVYLTILPAGENVKQKIIMITRNEVEIKDSGASSKIINVKDSQGKDIKLGIINVPSFYRNNAGFSRGDENFKSLSRDVKQMLLHFNTEKVAGAILDLRLNGGGSLEEAIDLTGLFIESGPVVQIKTSKGTTGAESRSDVAIFTKPVVVLQSKLSASASEIFAGALQDYKRAVLVGDKTTHGKGTVQTVFGLNPLIRYLGFNYEAGALKYTTAKFYRISGGSTQNLGVSSDIVIPSFTSVISQGEKDLDYALKWDSISKQKHKVYDKDITQKITILKKKSQDRIAKNPKFQELEKEIKRVKELRNKNIISLNEEERWKEYKAEKDLEEQQEKIFKSTQKGGENKDNDEASKNDLQLNEAKKIMIDYLALFK
ncbi:carboxy terminal-processing peptidase [Lentisphaerota bacterium WC36G]|nr:carboxy terminal-processing peptidase [Lentisphaerae bacterium WC36]